MAESRDTGMGGVFFQPEETDRLYDGYEKHLAIRRDPDGGVMFKWRHADEPDRTSANVWSPFPQFSPYFNPSRSPFMVNSRVHSLDNLLHALEVEGVTVEERRDDSDYGRFAWVMDPEGNRIELWEPPQE
jgi:catechol 2,3-dioxygenase-like lactoylglutathione lyase family enzyme